MSPSIRGRFTDENLAQEWEEIRAAVKQQGRDSETFRRAKRWVLVELFGSREQFLFDPLFSAKVKAAEQLLEQLDRVVAGKDSLPVASPHEQSE